MATSGVYTAPRLSGVHQAEGALVDGQPLTKGTSSSDLTAPGAAKGFVLAVANGDHADDAAVDALALVQGTIVPIRAGGAIADGAEVMCNNAGRWITAAGAGFVGGYTLEAATAANDIVMMQVTAYWKNS